MNRFVRKYFILALINRILIEFKSKLHFMKRKIIELAKIDYLELFEYSRSLLPIFTEEQHKMLPQPYYLNPFKYSNYYDNTISNRTDKISINATTTRHIYINEIQREFIISKIIWNIANLSYIPSWCFT